MCCFYRHNLFQLKQNSEVIYETSRPSDLKAVRERNTSNNQFMRITNPAPSEKLQLESLHEVSPRTVGAEAQPAGKILPPTDARK